MGISSWECCLKQIANYQPHLWDPKASRFAQEFFGQWLGYRDFLAQESVNRQVFPAFDDSLKQAMSEEPTRFIMDLIQNNQPITEFLDSDATFVNARLASHYGLPFHGTGDEWQRVTGLHKSGRGGVFAMTIIVTHTRTQARRIKPS